MNNGSNKSVAPTGPLLARVNGSLQAVRAGLQRNLIDGTHWAGKLSDSSLSTATAISALCACRKQFLQQPWDMDEHDQSKYGLTRWESLIENGSVWLAKGQNPDGGWSGALVCDDYVGSSTTAPRTYSAGLYRNISRSPEMGSLK